MKDQTIVDKHERTILLISISIEYPGTQTACRFSHFAVVIFVFHHAWDTNLSLPTSSPKLTCTSRFHKFPHSSLVWLVLGVLFVRGTWGINLGVRLKLATYPIPDPWDDWYIYLFEWLKLMVLVNVSFYNPAVILQITQVRLCPDCNNAVVQQQEPAPVRSGRLSHV